MNMLIIRTTLVCIDLKLLFEIVKDMLIMVINYLHLQNSMFNVLTLHFIILVNWDNFFYQNLCRQELEAPTSYIQNLVSRIINNVCLVCNNLVLKYVEDDIVLSINVKTFEMKAVNGEWHPAFIG